MVAINMAAIKSEDGVSLYKIILPATPAIEAAPAADGKPEVKARAAKPERITYSIRWRINGKSVNRGAKTEKLAKEKMARIVTLRRNRGIGATEISVEEINEAQTARDICESAQATETGEKMNIVQALQDWSRARRLVGDSIVEACAYWKDIKPKITPIRLSEAIKRFKAAKARKGFNADYIYGQKLNDRIVFGGVFLDRHRKEKPHQEGLGDRYLESFTAIEIQDFLEKTYSNLSTREDMLIRLQTLFNWARKARHLPAGRMAIEDVEQVKNPIKKVKPLAPDLFEKCLNFLLPWPRYKDAFVLGGLCGMRGAEIYGKYRTKSQGQMWDDIHCDAKIPYLNVTCAKESTPARRQVFLTPTAAAWLKSTWKDGVKPIGRVCPSRAVSLARDKLKSNGIAVNLAKNILRKSYITYAVAAPASALHLGKEMTADQAGTSVAKINEYYQGQCDPSVAPLWFNFLPPTAIPEAADRIDLPLALHNP